MDVHNIAEIFFEIAEFLEMKGENPFKVRAYDKAARIIDGLTRPIEYYAEKGELESIPGIGKSIAEKIAEILKTSKCQYYEDLKKEFPPAILTLMNIQGLGPKKAYVLYKELKIGSVEELEKAAREGRLRDLKGFGKKTEENILKGIEMAKSQGGRLLIGGALPMAEEIIAHLKKLPEVRAISEAGSLRRRKETIGDIDILVASNDSKPIMDAFVRLPLVKEILAKGDTKASVLTTANLQVDLRVVSPESYGAALQYFTGSKEHNIKLRTMAEAMGYKINEYGVFRVKDNKKMAGETEESVYKVLDLQMIPPEIRESGEEIKAARKGEIPRLVELEDIKGDLHVHSHWSDGVNTFEELAEQAQSIGYEYVGLSDHSQSLKVAKGLTPERMKKQGKEVDELNKKFKNFTILKGVELDILSDGKLDFEDELLEKLDIVTASVHSHFKQDKKTMTDRLCSACKNPNVDIIGHPSGRIIGQREGYEVDWDDFLKTAAKTKTAVEINSFPERLDLRDIYCKELKDLGGKVAINTDAHNIHQFGWMKFGVSVARRGWLESKDVLNTYGKDKLMKWLKSRKEK